MQIQSLRIKAYRSFRIDDTTPADAFERLGKIETYQALRAEGCSEATALHAIGWSRSAYYRWQARYRVDGVKGLAANPSSALDPFARMGRVADAQAISVHGQAALAGDAGPRGGGAVGIDDRADPGQRGAAGPDHAVRLLPGPDPGQETAQFCPQPCQRWRYGMKATRPGELIQIDHMSVSRDGDTLKQFNSSLTVDRYRNSIFVGKTIACGRCANRPCH